MSFFFTIRKLHLFTMKKVLIIHLIMEVVFWKLGQILLLEIQQYRWSRDVSLKPLTHLCLGSPNIVEPKLKPDFRCFLKSGFFIIKVIFQKRIL